MKSNNSRRKSKSQSKRTQISPGDAFAGLSLIKVSCELAVALWFCKLFSIIMLSKLRAAESTLDEEVILPVKKKENVDVDEKRWKQVKGF